MKHNYELGNRLNGVMENNLLSGIIREGDPEKVTFKLRPKLEKELTLRRGWRSGGAIRWAEEPVSESISKEKDTK